VIRSGFKRQQYQPPPTAPLHSLTRPVNMPRVGDVARTCPKEHAVVSEAYRDLVRAMPCARCGYPPRSQFCHTDIDKGMGLKTDDRQGWPGCGPHNNEPGCHWLLGSSGRLGKERRRELEAEYAAKTRAEIIRRGLWPKNLPRWEK